MSNISNRKAGLGGPKIEVLPASFHVRRKIEIQLLLLIPTWSSKALRRLKELKRGVSPKKTQDTQFLTATRNLSGPALLEHSQMHIKLHTKIRKDISWAFKEKIGGTPFLTTEWKSFFDFQSCRTFFSVLFMLMSNLSTLVVSRSRMSSCSSISVCIPRAMFFRRPSPKDSSSRLLSIFW